MNAVLSYIEASDRRLSSRVARWRFPRWVRHWMRVTSHLGDGWLWVACVGFMAFKDPTGLERSASLAVAVNGLLVVLKRTTRRNRPPEGGEAPVFDRYSFPSGHAMNAFAACGMLSLAEPALAAPALGIAANVAVSRVVVGRHYATDVIAGGALGIFAAVGAHLL